MAVNGKYQEGNYTCNKKYQVVRRLSENVVMSDDGKKAVKAYGSWQTEPNNILSFEPNVKTYLAEDDLKLITIQHLIDNGTLYRVL